MRTPNLDVALAVSSLLIASCVPTSARAQVADTAHRFSLFGGTTSTGAWDFRNLKNVEIGGSADFQLGSFPLPLRASVSFGQKDEGFSTLKFGTLALDAVARPLPRLFGTQLYFLGGLGLATRAEYLGTHAYLDAAGTGLIYSPFEAPRHNWGFLEGGVGLEVGRAFVQMKLQAPVASNGYTRVPLSVGFHF